MGGGGRPNSLIFPRRHRFQSQNLTSSTHYARIGKLDITNNFNFLLVQVDEEAALKASALKNVRELESQLGEVVEDLDAEKEVIKNKHMKYETNDKYQFVNSFDSLFD